MAENTIDTLSLDIKSNSGQAQKSLDRLTDALIKLAGGTSRGLGGLRTAASDIRALNDATKTLNSEKLTAYAAGLNDLSNSVGKFSDIESKITPAISALQQLSGINLSGLKVSGDFSGLSGLADIAPKLSQIKSVDLNRTSKAFEKLGTTDFSSFVNNLASLNGMDASGFISLSQALGAFAGSAEQLVALGKKDLNTAIRNIEKLGGINFSNLAQGASSLAGVDFSKLAIFGEAFRGFSDSLASANKVSAGTTRIFDSLSRLTQGATNIPALTAALPGLSSAAKDFISVMSTAPSVSKGTIALVSALSGIASSGVKVQKAADAMPALALSVREFINSMKSAPSVNSNIIKLLQSLGQFSQQGGRTGTIAGNLQRQFDALSGSAGRLGLSIKSISNGFKSFTRQLLSAMGIYLGIFGAVRGLQISIKTFSDLVEIQNVVDKTFGDMTEKVEELSKISIPNFGMSELTVKNIASRYQAMGVAMGFAQDEMSDMSIELTKLAADMASFYNVEQSMVSEKLESIFTGTTRPLRTFGLDLSQATLQTWALKNGLDANVKSMDQMEKTILRYQYVMAQTKFLSGDFRDTQLTMANQTRILAQSFEQLASVIGGVLVNAFKPLVAWLNRAMQSIIAFAQTVANALGKIFGWTYEIKGGGVANDFEDAGIAAEEMADGTGAAKDNLKEMQKYIAAWHEVSNMTTSGNDTGGGKGGGGGAGGGELGDAIGGQLVRTESLFDKYKSDIDSLYDLGKYISSVLSNAMESIDWNSIYKKADKFGQGLADFLNGLINPRLFENTGKTIAGSLNTALHFLDSFGTRFDWKNFGKSIAAGINGFFGAFDFSRLAHTINVWVKGILDTIITAIDKTNWKLVGKRIGTFLAKIDFWAIMGKVGKAIWKAINAAFDTYSKMFDVAPFETVLLSLVAIPKLLKTSKIVAFVKSIATGTTTVINFGKALLGSQTALAALNSAGFPGAARAAAVLGDSLSLVVMGFSDMIRTGVGSGQFLAGVNAAFLNIRENLTGTQKGVITAVSAFAEFQIVQGSVKDLVTGTGNLAISILKIVGAVGAAGIALSAVFSFPAGAIAAGVIGLVSAFVGLKKAQDEIADTSSIGKFSDSINEVSEEVSRRTEQIKGDLHSIQEEAASAGDFQAERARKLADEYERLANITYRTGAEEMRMRDIAKELGEIIPGVSDYIDEQTGYLDIQRETLDDLINSMELYAKRQALASMLTKSYEAQYDAEMNVARAQEDLNKAVEDFVIANDGMSESVKNMIQEGDIQGLRDLKTQLWDVEQNSWKLAQAFGENVTSGRDVDKMIDSLEQAMGGYAEALSDAKETQADAVDTTNRLYDSIMENNTALSLQEERNLANVKATDEYQRSLRNLTYEFSELGTSVSDEFLEKLALDESRMAESVIASFTRMKEGIQLEAGELQTLFSNIAPGMSNGFISSLAEQEPQMQSQIAMTFANLSSGAQIPFEEMKTVFKTIGYELPDETISGLQEKAPFVQASVINLLAEAKSGAGLIGPDLLAVFGAMGIALPTEMINSIQSMDGPTQAQVIELFGQLITGCDLSAGEVLQRFSEFGLAVPAELQNAIESGTTGVYLKGQGLLEELASAASPAERTRILKEYNDLGEDVISNGLLAALNSKNESVRSEAGGLINQVTSATTGEERDAAIAALNKFAEDFVEEGFIGPMRSAAEELEGEGRKAGENTILGYNSGVKDNSLLSQDAVQDWQSDINTAIHDSEMNYGSPSRTAWEYGKSTIEGFNIGITENESSTSEALNTWINGMMDILQVKVPETINHTKDLFFDLPDAIYDSISPAFEKIREWREKTDSEFEELSNHNIDTVVELFSNLPDLIHDEITRFIDDILPEWSDNINSFFDQTIPKIIKNVVSLFGDLKESLIPVGENLIKGLWDGIHGLTDWLGTKIGGFCRGIINKFKEGFDEHSPSKEAYKIGDFFTRGLQNGMAEKFGDVYGDVKGFTDSISSIKMTPLELDLSVPDFSDYKTRSYDMGAIQSKIQMEFDAKMAQMAYENQRTQEMLEQIVDAIERKQLIVGDHDIFEANRRETLRFGKRSKKDPYPIYGRYK